MTAPGEGHPDKLPDDEQTEIMWRIIRDTLMGEDAAAEEPHLVASAETYSSDVDELRNRCVEEATGAFAQLQEQLESGLPLDHRAATVAGMLLFTLIQEAGDKDDTRSVDQYTATLDRITNAPAIVIATDYFAAAMAGSERAITSLRARLEAERAHAHWMPSERHSNVSRPPNTPLLTGVMETCIENAIPPDEWITNYAIDDRHIWFLYMLYYQGLSLSGHKVEEASIQRYEQTIVDGYHRLPPTYANQVGPRVLSIISRADLRARVLTRYTATVTLHSSNNEAQVQTVRGVFGQVVWDPDLAVMPAAATLAAFLDAGAHIKGGFVDDWQVDRKRFNGATASELLEYINEQTRESLAAGAQFDVFSALASNSRDMTLHRYAQQFAAQGRFDEAKICLQEIVASEVRESASQRCIQWARSDEDIGQITPSQNALTGNPELGAPFRLAAAQRRGDISDLEAMAREFAQQPPRRGPASDDSALLYHEQPEVRAFDKSAPPPSDIGAMLGNNRRAHYIQALHLAVNTIDNQRGQQLARDLLVILRGQQGRNDNSPSVRYLSEALMKARDPDELRYVHRTIEERGVSRPLAILKIIAMSRGRVPAWLPPLLGPA